MTILTNGRFSDGLTPAARLCCAVFAMLATGTLVCPQSLPVVEEVSDSDLRSQCPLVMKALEGWKAPLPAETAKSLDATLQAKDISKRLQELLDARCLIGVTINPESRVSAARGPLRAELVLDKPVLVLVKVHNEAGVTAPLKVAGPQIRTARISEGRWLEATIKHEPPLGKTLSGKKLEYVVLQLVAREAGKREATLRFDVGQGTQDLGFRAEVPILFTVRKK